MKNLTLPLIFLLFFVSIICFAQVPRQITYQGIVDSSATINGNRPMRFKIYDDVTGGNLLWTEDHSVAITEGHFQVVLGSITPLDLPFDKPYWLGISIKNAPELEPRTALTSVAYSINAGAVNGWHLLEYNHFDNDPEGWTGNDGFEREQIDTSLDYVLRSGTTAGGYLEKTYSALPSYANAVRIELTLYLIDSWDDEDVYIDINNQRVWAYEVLQTGAFDFIGNSSWGETVENVNIIYPIPAGTTTCTVTIGSNLSNGFDDECIGIDDVFFYIGIQ